MKLETLRGTVLPGPTMSVPYTMEHRCVAWISARPNGMRGQCLPFDVQLEDGRVLAVQTAECGGVLPVRSSFSYTLPSPTQPRRWHRLQDDGWGRQRPARPRTDDYSIGWIEVGDTVEITGVVSGAVRLQRERLTLLARQLRVPGTELLTVEHFAPGDPEDP